MARGEEEEEASLTPSQLLQLAETHLRVRNFSLCRQYALESLHPNDPHRRHNHRRAAQIAAISDILLSASSSSFPNFYSILQVDTFSNDFNLIRTRFKTLLHLLEPIKNKSPLANEALEFVWKAYNSLLNPSSKTQLDSQLQSLISSQNPEGTFWTFCPYCFYMYQYSRVYEGCCLRCNNETCRRVFHGIALCTLPRMDFNKGRYFACFGYFPLGFSPSEGKSKKKFKSWSPIVGFCPTKGTSDLNRGGDFVEVLDDADELESPVEGNEFGSNSGPNVANHGTMKNTNDVAGGSASGVDTGDVNFFEEDGEIFVDLGQDGDDAY